MTFAPRTLSELAAFWMQQGGVHLGIVGNRAHTIGYHLGRDRIYDGGGPGIGDKDYSVQHPRDKAGLSNAASAIDLGRLDGSLAGLRKFSKWLVAACQDDRILYRDIREIIYSPDGERVQRYSGADGLIHKGAGNGDTSHLTHTHISWFRDSVGRDKRPLFAPYFAAIPDTSTGDDPVKSFSVPEVRTLAKVADLAWLYDNSALAASPKNVRLSPARELVLVGTFSDDVRIVAYEPATADANTTSKAMFVRASDIKSTRPAVDLTPYSKGDLDAAVAKHKAVLDARTTALRAIASEATEAASTPPSP